MTGDNEDWAILPENSPSPHITDDVRARYLRKLTGWAMRALRNVKEVRGNFEDVVGSAMRTRERQEQAGELPAPETTQQLWEQLRDCFNKKIDQYKQAGRNRLKENFLRDADRSADPDQPRWVEGVIAGNLTPEDVDSFVHDGMELARAAISDPQLLEITRLTMMSHDTREIAGQLDLSEHQVRRRMTEVRRQLQGYLDDMN